MTRKSLLASGEPAPWFVCATESRLNFHFDTVAGRYVVLCFFGSAARTDSRRILDDFMQADGHFDDQNACFFGVSIDPDDKQQARVRERVPGVRFFWDFDARVSREYGACPPNQTGNRLVVGEYRRHTLVLDPRLRVVASLPFDRPPEAHVPRVLEVLAALPPIGRPSIATPQAPILTIPRIFEPDLCRALIRYYVDHGGEESGFMRTKDGMTVAVHDYSHKRRRDREIGDQRLRDACMNRIHDRLVPEIRKAFQFHATRIERYLVACYDANVGGHFRAHRDNTTKGTAHRRFAVSLHLNTGEYEGGQLRFPEFGPQLYTAPVGGAVVFSCSLLHEATPVTRGCRYMFLPFLYDDEAAKIREANQQFLVDDVPSRRASRDRDATP